MGRSLEALSASLGIPVENFHPTEPGLHMEILDTRTQEVWQVMANVSVSDFASLEVADPYRKVGLGSLASYTSFFRCSPDDDDAPTPAPMKTLDYGGYRWSLCARPMGSPRFPAGRDGPALLRVNKHHGVVYAAGTELKYVESPDGACYVEVVRAPGGATDPVLPPGWKAGSVHLESERVVELPCPTEAFFMKNFDSYQGPVPRPV